MGFSVLSVNKMLHVNSNHGNQNWLSWFGLISVLSQRNNFEKCLEDKGGEHLFLLALGHFKFFMK